MYVPERFYHSANLPPQWKDSLFTDDLRSDLRTCMHVLYVKCVSPLKRTERLLLLRISGYLISAARARSLVGVGRRGSLSRPLSPTAAASFPLSLSPRQRHAALSFLPALSLSRVPSINGLLAPLLLPLPLPLCLPSCRYKANGDAGPIKSRGKENRWRLEREEGEREYDLYYSATRRTFGRRK